MLNNLELLHATYQTHSFPKHMHEEFCIGVMMVGHADLYYRKTNYDVPAGSLITLNAGEVHANRMVQGTYRMMYPDAGLVKQIASEIVGKDQSMPFFPEPIVHDQKLYNLILKLHFSLEQQVAELAKQSLLMHTFTCLIQQLAENYLILPKVGKEYYAVALARDYIEAFYYRNITLWELSKVTNFSSFYLTRIFRKALGLSLHSYLLQVRINHAKKFLSKGEQISQIALKLGFTDHSHFTKQFKRFTGVTPRKYLSALKT